MSRCSLCGARYAKLGILAYNGLPACYPTCGGAVLGMTLWEELEMQKLRRASYEQQQMCLNSIRNGRLLEEEQPDHWLRNSFDRAQERIEQIPKWARPTLRKFDKRAE